MRSLPLSIALPLWTSAALLRPLKRVLPLETLVRLMCRASGHRASRGLEQRLESYLSARDRFPWRAPANCLERSLGAYRLLCAAQASPELVIGVRRGAAHPVEGHVWVQVHGRPLAERPEDLATYTIVATFDAAARRHPSARGGTSLVGIPLR